MQNTPPTWSLTTTGDTPAGSDASNADTNAALFKDDGKQPAFQQQLKIKTIVSAATEPSEDQANRLGQIQAADNPLLEAAKPLMLTLAQMPEELQDNVRIEAFRQLLEQEVVNFQALCNKANIRREHTITASYCLCTALDEAAASTRWGGASHSDSLGIWAARPLAGTLHGDVDGGTKFFLLIAKLIKNQQEHIHLIELLYQILCLGFKGQYSTQSDGNARLAAIGERLLLILETSRQPAARSLSVHGMDNTALPLNKLSKIPAWIAASVLGLILFSMFTWYQFSLGSKRNEVVAQINAIENALPPPSSQVTTDAALPSNLQLLLSDEIKKQLVSVSSNANQDKIIFAGDNLFASGKDQVTDDMQPLLYKVADAISKLHGQIQIIGYTDNKPIRSPQFKDNNSLSYSRAASVATIFEKYGIPETRMDVIGRGDQNPVASNATVSGRSKNRRIEITIIHPHNDIP